MNAEELDRLETICNEASPGPWIVETGKYSGKDWLIGSFLVGNSRDGKDYHVTTDHVHASEMGGSDAKCDAEFIACAREAMPILIAEIRRLSKK